MSGAPVDAQWLTPKQLFDVLPIGAMPFSEQLAVLRRGLEFTHTSAAEFYEFEEKFAQRARGVEQGRTLMVEELRRAGAAGVWIAYGKRMPDGKEERIATRYWNHLQIDFERATASSEKFGLYFDEIRCYLPSAESGALDAAPVADVFGR